jgi:Na+-translocating ferredoxin:NAD+ oxidoreductase subunit B
MSVTGDRLLVERIDVLLPQTQCGRCGHDRCRPYAEALAIGQAPLNRCPPGGRATIDALAGLLARPPLPLDPACGAEGPLAVAFIDETDCIGCTLCIQACPVDAIVGVSKRMHTVLAELCSGCERCVVPCPVDCIRMLQPEPARNWTADDAQAARRRMQARDRRLDRERLALEARLAAREDEACEPDPAEPATPRAGTGIAALVADALARARARRAARNR